MEGILLDAHAAADLIGNPVAQPAESSHAELDILCPGHSRSPPMTYRLAAAVRGGRGSQLHDIQDQRGDDQRWQPPSAEGAEDRNNAGNPHLYAQVGVWRSPSAVAGDRNEADTLIINQSRHREGRRWPSAVGEVADENVLSVIMRGTRVRPQAPFVTYGKGHTPFVWLPELYGADSGA
ncbi:MAG: hypothetical protein ACLPN6_30215 [Streptosporangiaceae bacterium]